jgi:hypothetical protein
VTELVQHQAARPAAAAARSNWLRRKFCTRSGVPTCDAKTRSSGLRPASWTARSSRRNRGTGTRRRAWDFGDPRTMRPSTWVIDSVPLAWTVPGSDSVSRTRSAGHS